MVVGIKESFEKTRHVKITTNLKNIFYVDKEIQDIMKKFSSNKKKSSNFIISTCLGYVANTEFVNFPSRIEMDRNEEIILKIREDIPTKSTEVNIESARIAQEEPVSFDTTDPEQTTEKKNLESQGRSAECHT